MAEAMIERLPYDVVENPVTGERIVFTEPAAQRGGDRLRFDFFVRPGGGVPQPHRHSDQEEWMRCVEGELTLTVDGEEVVLGPGDEITIAARSTHEMVNRGDQEVHCEVEYRPAGRNEDWFRLIHGFAYRHGREPSVLDLAPFLPDVGILVPSPPERVQQLVVQWVLRPLGIALGRRRRMLRTAAEVYGRPVTW